MSRNQFSYWELFIIFFGLETVRFRIQFILWLIRCIPLVFRGCEEYPVPKGILQRLAWYLKRVIGLIGIYKWMMEPHKKKNK